MLMDDSPQDETIKLISAEGHEFIIDKNAAMVSGTIKSMLSGPVNFSENSLNEVSFREISTPILEKVIQYFYYKLKYTNSSNEIPEFPIEPEIALELLMAANFLDA
eukprot:TRINITY_DN3668_c0_g1_i1.p1 TRINITY_DN3668_c0_g1~~TRINITY_DN3668_c0_g1_i1.p1  ORF type:complete len:106 (+),score=24.03 TRINITY_DN3668_c0_g1_i1:55-372(+)